MAQEHLKNTRPRGEFHFSNARWKAFHHAVMSYAEELPEPILLEKEGTPESSVKAVRQLLDQNAPVDALVCGSSIFAVGALLELAARDVPVPEGMAVAGIGNVELAPFLKPSLTAISTEPRLIGIKAGEMMLSHMRGEEPPSMIVNVGVKLIRRNSA